MLKNQFTASAIFGPVDAKDMGRRSLRGIGVTLSSQLTKLVLQTGAIILLGRLLSPADFGLVAMVAVVANFIGLFKDAGLAQATVQRDSINHAQISSLFWLNLILSTGLALLVVACGPLLGWFYQDPRLLGLTMVLALPLILSGLCLQHRALLQRNMRFGDIARAEVLAIAFGGIVGVFCAWRGLGYWSLAVMQIANATASSAIIWTLAAWKPGLPTKGTGIRQMVRFGLNLSGAHFLGYLSANTDKFLLGKYVGAAALGQYSLAFRFLLLPLTQINAPINSVLVPALSRLQDDQAGYERLFFRYLGFVSWITAVPIALSAVVGERLIVLFMGEIWHEAGVIFGILAFGAVVIPIGNLTGVLFVSTGNTASMFRWAMITMPVRLLGFVVGLKYGASGVAFGYTVTTLVMSFPCWWFACSVNKVSFWGFLNKVALPLASALAVAVLAQLFLS